MLQVIRRWYGDGFWISEYGDGAFHGERFIIRVEVRAVTVRQVDCFEYAHDHKGLR